MLIHVAIVSDQLLPTVIPCLIHRPDRVVLAASQPMTEKAKRLRRVLQQHGISVEIRGQAPDAGLDGIRAYATKLADELTGGLVGAPPPHDFLGHSIGAYCPLVKEVFMVKSKAERGRFSSRKKMDVVLRVLRGDDLDLVSREAGITAATVSAWRDQFVASGQAGLKSRAGDGRDDELARLKALVGDLTMRLELSREAVQRLRGGAPLATGRSTR